MCSGIFIVLSFHHLDPFMDNNNLVRAAKRYEE